MGRWGGTTAAWRIRWTTVYAARKSDASAGAKVPRAITLDAPVSATAILAEMPPRDCTEWLTRSCDSPLQSEFLQLLIQIAFEFAGNQYTAGDRLTLSYAAEQGVTLKDVWQKSGIKSRKSVVAAVHEMEENGLLIKYKGEKYI